MEHRDASELDAAKALVHNVIRRYDEIARRLGRERVRSAKVVGVGGRADSILEALQAEHARERLAREDAEA